MNQSERATAVVERGDPDRFVLSRPGLPDFEVVAAVDYDEMRTARDRCKRQATEAGERAAGQYAEGWKAGYAAALKDVMNDMQERLRDA